MGQCPLPVGLRCLRLCLGTSRGLESGGTSGDSPPSPGSLSSPGVRGFCQTAAGPGFVSRDPWPQSLSPFAANALPGSARVKGLTEVLVHLIVGETGCSGEATCPGSQSGASTKPAPVPGPWSLFVLQRCGPPPGKPRGGRAPAPGCAEGARLLPPCGCLGHCSRVAAVPPGRVTWGGGAPLCQGLDGLGGERGCSRIDKSNPDLPNSRA